MVSREPMRKFQTTLQLTADNEDSVTHEKRNGGGTINYYGAWFDYRFTVRHGFPLLEILFSSGRRDILSQIGTSYLIGDGDGADHFSGDQAAELFIMMLRDNWNEQIVF